MSKDTSQKSWICLLFLMALSLSSVSSKLAGSAWLFLVAAGLVVAWQAKAVDPCAKNAATQWALVWLVCAALALVFKAVPMLYWHDRWDERHAEIRLLLGAVGTYALCRWRPTFSCAQQMAVAWAMSVSCAWALLLVLVEGRDGLPTNAIPWAAGMALFSACLLAWSLAPNLTRMNRLGGLAGGLLGLAAVLASESRGAYGLVLLWLVLPLLLWMHVKVGGAFVWLPETGGLSWTRRRILGFVLAIVVGLGLVAQTAVVQRPLQRIQAAVQEVELSQESLEAGANSSVGARLFMWSHSVPFIAQSPWLGHGQEARKAAIKNWGQAANSAEVLSLGHAHNEYLHTLMDHGLWGLASLLSYAFGMLWICVRMWKSGHLTQAWAMGGVLFMHVTTGLTNVNLAHNYYPTMLSLVIGLVLMASASQEKSSLPG